MKSCNEIFLEQARIGYANYFRLYHNKKRFQILNDRKHNQNKRFVFDDYNLTRVERINNLLDKKLKDAYHQAGQLEQNLIHEIENKNSFISDYEIDFNLSLYAENKYKDIEDLQGNSFFEFRPTIGYYKYDKDKIFENEKHKEWLLNTNHNEYENTGHPLKNQHHCWLLHELYDHTYLSWQDIVDIEEVWFEVILTVQNFESIKFEENEN